MQREEDGVPIPVLNFLCLFAHRLHGEPKLPTLLVIVRIRKNTSRATTFIYIRPSPPKFFSLEKLSIAILFYTAVYVKPSSCPFSGRFSFPHTLAFHAYMDRSDWYAPSQVNSHSRDGHIPSPPPLMLGFKTCLIKTRIIFQG